jgi:hypothetical protein
VRCALNFEQVALFARGALEGIGDRAMDVWGLILSGMGAVLIAAGQEMVASVTDVWLRAHETFLTSFVGGRDVHRISGVDDQMDRAVRKTRWLSRIGWLLFVVGIVLQIIPHFRHDGWRALCEPLINLCS